jgi:hypothetical protein
LLLLALALSACTDPDSKTAGLTWTGQALEGAAYATRAMPHVTVHYPVTLDPEQAERLGNATGLQVENQIRAGFLKPGGKADVWVVPAGAPWPKGLPKALPGRGALAVAPLTVVIREESVPEAQKQGLPEAVAVAGTQGAGSPAYAVAWLNEGLGQVLSADLEQFPMQPYQRVHKNLGADVTGPALLQKLQQEPSTEADVAAWRDAAVSLTALVMDRWGVRFGDTYPRTPGQMTPAAAAIWATGAPDEAAALNLWAERLHYVGSTPEDGPPTASMADMSPVRVEPKPVRGAGPGPMDNYSPHAYQIEARYEPATRTVAGEMKLTWQNGEGVGLDTLYFNLWPNAEQYARFGGAIAIDAVTVDGTAAAFQARGLDLIVPLGRSVPQGQGAVVTVRFTTTLPARITPRVFGQDEERLFNLAHWYPILAVLDERGWNLHAMPDFPGEPHSESSRYTVTLNVPKETLVAATGHQTGREEQGGRWVYSYDAPNVRDWVAVGGKNLSEVTRQVGDVTVRVIDPDRNLGQTMAEETEKALRLLQPQFGNYPYKDLVVVPCCAGLEYPGLFYTRKPDPAPDNWWHAILAHELTHEWFFGVVASDQYSEAWLDEGFAKYGERYFVKAFGYTDQLRDLKRDTINEKLRVNSSTVSFNLYGSYTRSVYDRGALVLEDLEALLGEATFRRLMHTWVERYQYKTPTTGDFVRLAEEVSGQNLQAFFAAHRVDPALREVYRPSIPLGAIKPQ